MVVLVTDPGRGYIIITEVLIVVEDEEVIVRERRESEPDAWVNKGYVRETIWNVNDVNVTVTDGADNTNTDEEASEREETVFFT